MINGNMHLPLSLRSIFNLRIEFLRTFTLSTCASELRGFPRLVKPSIEFKAVNHTRHTVLRKYASQTGVLNEKCATNVAAYHG